MPRLPNHREIPPPGMRYRHEHRQCRCRGWAVHASWCRANLDQIGHVLVGARLRDDRIDPPSSEISGRLDPAAWGGRHVKTIRRRVAIPPPEHRPDDDQLCCRRAS